MITRVTSTSIAILFIANYAINSAANAQNSPNSDQNTTSSAQSSCKAPRDISAQDLYGAWVLEIATDISVSSTRLVLRQNPEFEGSLAGLYNLGGIRHEVFGDVEDGEIEFEETVNGKDASALWKGRIQEGSCGKTIMGTRQSVSFGEKEIRGEPQAFTLKRSGW